MEHSIVFGLTHRLQRLRVLGQYLSICAALALLTYAGFALGANLLTMVFVYLSLVVAAALLFGFWQASFTSALAVVLLDYYFVPPIFKLEIADPRDWVALGAFEVTALAISRLHAREKRSTEAATQHRKEMEQLYELGRNTLLLDMSCPPGAQIVVLIQRIFGADTVALFDADAGREDRAGDWDSGEEDLAKECYLRGSVQNNSRTQTAQRLLETGHGIVGALVARGRLSPTVMDALASFAAIAIDRRQVIEKEERAENASRSEQLRAAVMDALAHEFKTPLTAVQTASSGLLELGGLAAAQKDLVTLIDEQVIRLNQLCTRLLLTAKLETEEVGLDKERVDVRELIFEVLARGPLEAERDRMQVLVDDPALTMDVDRGLVAMILTQYVDNARKYSPPGTPIEIAARKSRTEAIISVHNFGPAIRIEDRERIFDRFYRSPEMKDAVPGTGIGLSVVRKAAEAHHGHVWVISDEKEGTTFFLSLPAGAGRKH